MVFKLFSDVSIDLMKATLLADLANDCLARCILIIRVSDGEYLFGERDILSQFVGVTFDRIADFTKLQRVLPSLLDRITYYLYAQRLSLVGAFVVTL